MINPVRALRVTEAGRQELAVAASALPDNLPANLIVPPGTYVWHGAAIPMQLPGLYQFGDIVSSRAQRIVFDPASPRALLSAIAALTVHGDADDALVGGAASASAALTKTLVHTCGDAAPLAVYLLGQCGYSARIVNGITLQAENSYDNGHTMIEVLVGGKWQAADTDMKYTFHDAGTGEPLDLVGLYDRLPAGDVEFRPLTDDPCVNDPQFQFAWVMDVSDDPLDWYRRAFGVVWMGAEKVALCETPAQQQAAAAYGVAALDRATFLARFYSAQLGAVHYGARPDTVTGWGGVYTVVDLSNAIAAGAEVASIGLMLNASHAGLVPLIVARTAADTFDVAWSGAPAANVGGDYSDFAAGFTAPADGRSYFPAFVANLPSTPGEAFCSTGTRALCAGDARALGPNGDGRNVTARVQVDGTIGTRWTQA